MTPEAFLEVADLLPDAILLLTTDGVVLAANRACAELVDRSQPTIAGKRLAELVTDPPDKIAHFLHLCGRTRDPLPGSFAFRCNGAPVECRCDGTLASPASVTEPALILLHARPKHELSTRFRLLNEMIESLWKQIGERERAEAALRASEEFNRRILMSSGDCIQVLNLDGTILSMNEASYSAMGLDSSNEPVGTQWTTLWRGEDRLASQQALDQARAGQRGRFYASSSSKRTGQKWWDVQITPILNSQQVPERLVAVARDITERRLSEEQLRQSAKMEAIGRMAGGLAHDFNNNLHVLSGLAAFVEQDPGLRSDTRRDLLEIKAVAEHMASLTRQLLAFSRRQVLRLETVDMNQAAAEAQPLLQRLLGGNIDFRLELSAGPLWVEVDRAQLLQVMMNLAINARDAMTGGGELVIQTSQRNVAPRELDSLAGAPVEPATYAQLTVSDNGSGIAPEHLSHIFEPFFTTKPIGEGTGLGLATTHGIIKQSQGHIWVESQPGRGSRFTILLRLASSPSSTNTERTETSRPGRGALVLVVEDDEHVRSIAARTLQSGGFDVMQARNGEEALECLNKSQRPVQLVLSDVTMPTLGGHEFAERLAAEHGAIPVLWVSGKPLDAALSDHIRLRGHAFLQKPIAPTHLVNTVQHLLQKVPVHGSSLRLMRQ